MLNIRNLLVSQKYELEDQLNLEQGLLENLLLNDPQNSTEISNKVEKIERITQNIARIDARVGNPYENEAVEENNENNENDGENENNEENNMPPLEGNNHQNMINFMNFFANGAQPTNGAGNFLVFHGVGGGGVGFNLNAENQAAENENENEAEGDEMEEDEMEEEEYEEDGGEEYVEINPVFMAGANGQGGGGNNNFAAAMQMLVQRLERVVNDANYENYSNLEDVKVPLKEEVAKSLHVSKYSNIDPKYRDDRNIQCSICLSEYDNEDAVYQLNCDHIYHTDCINQWFKSNSKCPVCKYDNNDIDPQKV